MYGKKIIRKQNWYKCCHFSIQAWWSIWFQLSVNTTSTLLRYTNVQLANTFCFWFRVMRRKCHLKQRWGWEMWEGNYNKIIISNANKVFGAYIWGSRCIHSSILLVSATPGLNAWTDVDETLHTCSLWPADVMKEDNPGSKISDFLIIL